MPPLELKVTVKLEAAATLLVYLTSDWMLTFTGVLLTLPGSPMTTGVVPWLFVKVQPETVAPSRLVVSPYLPSSRALMSRAVPLLAPLFVKVQPTKLMFL